ncbi:hypothetical protein [Bradyrhizobium sp. SSUT77]|uniref:hypothetical protein n=1 Tax=Bradyrhizobium sp. SSUT77 TaxID=3040603 RepID=UPI00244D47F6|nr:hypothetical protein [Bradyrhizobium sp. SSUT77]MDH2348308.1 hypothetical protein [Bradyrhizobium sp. SSUT77]
MLSAVLSGARRDYPISSFSAVAYRKAAQITAPTACHMAGRQHRSSVIIDQDLETESMSAISTRAPARPPAPWAAASLTRTEAGACAVAFLQWQQAHLLAGPQLRRHDVELLGDSLADMMPRIAGTCEADSSMSIRG